MNLKRKELTALMSKRILAIDTSTKACSVAICSFEEQQPKIGNNFTVLFQSVCNIKITHSQTAMPIVRDAFNNSLLSPSDIDYFAVSRGPGSFTGLRIGISIIKGLACDFTQNQKNCIAIDSLKALAYNKHCFNGLIIPAMDARQGRIFFSIFDNTDGLMNPIEENSVDSIDNLVKKIKNSKKEMIFVGDGAYLCYNNMKLSDGNCAFSIGEDYSIPPYAGAVAYCASLAVIKGETLSCDDIIPLYIQKPQAQRELENSLKIQN